MIVQLLFLADVLLLQLVKLCHLVVDDLVVVGHRVGAGVYGGRQGLGSRVRFRAEGGVATGDELVGRSASAGGPVDVDQVFCAHDGLSVLRGGRVPEASEVACDRLTAAEVGAWAWQAAVFRGLLVRGIALSERPRARRVRVGLLLVSALQTDDEGVHDEATGRVATCCDLRLSFVLVVSQGRLRLPVDVLLDGLLGGLRSRGLVGVASGDRRGLDVEVDAAQASQDADVVGTVVGAGCVVIRLIGLVIQLFLHVRIQQVEVVDVVDLDLRR